MPEAKKQMERVLEEIAQPKRWPERLQPERGLEVLEWLGTEDVEQVLRELHQEAKNDWLEAGVGSFFCVAWKGVQPTKPPVIDNQRYCVG